jgi:uncharacterized protein with PIN domain
MSRRPEQLTFPVDRNLGKRFVLAAALRAPVHAFLTHDDYFADTASDVEIIREAGRRGWMLLTRDRRQTSRPAEAAAIASACILHITLHGARAITTEQLVSTFVNAIGTLVAIKRSRVGSRALWLHAPSGRFREVSLPQ